MRVPNLKPVRYITFQSVVGSHNTGLEFVVGGGDNLALRQPMPQLDEGRREQLYHAEWFFVVSQYI